jgi:hypothetical protein
MAESLFNKGEKNGLKILLKPVFILFPYARAALYLNAA